MGKVGLMGLRPPGSNWETTKELAILAEELGYDNITMGESWAEDAFTSLAQISAVTNKIRIGTSIVPVYARTPANLAMTALNMDVMSNGRFFLGLGSSGKLVIEDFHGEEFRKPLSRMREYITFLRKASRGETLDHDGQFFNTKRFKIRFPAYRENLPIYIASLTPASLKMTGELADGWLPIYYAPGRMSDSYAKLKEGTDLAGRTLDDITVSPQVSINRDRQGAADLVTDEMVAATALIGTPEECSSQMKKYFDDGVDEIRLVFNEPDAEGYRNIIESMAPFI